MYKTNRKVHSNNFSQECEFVVVTDWAGQMNVWFICNNLWGLVISSCRTRENISYLQEKLINALMDNSFSALNVTGIAKDGSNRGHWDMEEGRQKWLIERKHSFLQKDVQVVQWWIEKRHQGGVVMRRLRGRNRDTAFKGYHDISR